MQDALTLGFDPVEDRLVLSISKESGETAELHLTRRFTRAFAVRLASLATETAAPPAAASAQQRSKLASLHHDAIAQDLPIETTRGRPPRYAEGARPALVTGVRFGRSRSRPEHRIIELRCQDEQTVKLTLSPRLLHGFIELLRRRLTATDWGVELLAPQPEVDHRSVVH